MMPPSLVANPLKLDRACGKKGAPNARVGRELARLGGFLLLAIAVLACPSSGPKRSDDRGEGESVNKGAVAGKLAMADGLEVAYTLYGEGDTTLVFVHGWSGEQSVWSSQVDFFASRYAVLTLDLPGHGASGKTRNSWTVAQMGHDLAATLTGLGIRKAILVGHSLGGPVALVAAGDAPDSVAAIIGIDSFHRPQGSDPPTSQELFQRLRADFPNGCRSFVRGLFDAETEEGLVDRTALAMCAAPPEIALPLLEDLSRFPLGPTLQKTRQPIRAINSQHGTPTEIAALQQLKPGFDAVWVDKTGHFPMLEQPDELNRQLAQVLLGFEPPTSP